jgi:tryptophan-rich sensory protein
MVPRISETNPEGGDRPRLSTVGWIWNILYIAYSLEVGIALLYLPWSPSWDNNYILYLYPQIRAFVANPFFKGAVLGLGIVNILIGFHEIGQIRKAWKKYRRR